MRYEISSYELLKQMLAELNDDLNLPWRTYPCLEWPRSRLSAGYGRVRVGERNRVVYAHVLSYEFFNGPLPAGQHALHHCDNPPCFRGSHIFAGSLRDNMQDCIAKGRLRRGDKRGTKNGRAKLTESQVLAIRQLRASGWELKPLASKFGVAFSIIQRIEKREIWPHI